VVFGYGSLMWRPGFECMRSSGAPDRQHRALCVYSFDHRGTPRSPGWCSGSTAAAPCRGIAFRVAAAKRDHTIEYLRSREQTTMSIASDAFGVAENEARQRVSALAYVVDRGHVQYAGRLSLAEQLRYVQQARPLGKQPRLRAVDGEMIEAQAFPRPAIASASLMLHARRRAWVTSPPWRGGSLA